MIKDIIGGNMFESGADALVCPVNCVGVMGKGLAKTFKNEFPGFYAAYKFWCRKKIVEIGSAPLWVHPDLHIHIVAFPTKNDWREKSKMEYVEAGLKALKGYIDMFFSIAIPAVGCGLGGLDWPDVRDLIYFELQSADCDVYLYAPINVKRQNV